jgi:hypothetical protein
LSDCNEQHASINSIRQAFKTSKDRLIMLKREPVYILKDYKDVLPGPGSYNVNIPSINGKSITWNRIMSLHKKGKSEEKNVNIQ